jgi:carbon monoxide dehydrogenase subunit G
MLVEGQFIIEAPRERVWRFITDPAIMAPCVPGCEAIESIGNITELAQSWDSGPIKVSFNLEVEITEEKAPELVTFVTRGEEGSRSSVVSAKSSLRLDALSAQQTEVRYSSDVNGRLGKFGSGLMRKKADELGKQFGERFRACVIKTDQMENI